MTTALYTVPKQETISTSDARLEHFTCNYLFSISTERQNRLSPVKYVVVSQRLEKDHVRVEVQNEVTLAVQIGSQLSWATAVDRVEVVNWSETPPSSSWAVGVWRIHSA